MLDDLRAVSPAAASIGTVVNTHANGDHCYGNQLVAGADIVASSASAREMDEVPPAMLAGLMQATDGLGEAGAYLRDIFGSVHLRRHRAGRAHHHLRRRARAAGRRPGRAAASSSGPPTPVATSIVHVPDAEVLFTGDLVFHGGHPIVWAGPIAHWIEACDRMLALGAATVVPGHGPLGDRACIEDQRGYLEWLVAEGTPRLTGGMAPLDAARDLAGGPYDGWGERERLVVNLTALARDLGRNRPPMCSPSSAAWPSCVDAGCGPGSCSGEDQRRSGASRSVRSARSRRCRVAS